MNKTEILEFIANHENSCVEFKSDGCHPDHLAKEMAALLNLEGGVILLGVEDDGQISGLTRGRTATEEWVMNIARQNLQPPTNPVWTCIDIEHGKAVGVVKLAADSLGKPYKARRGQAWVTFTRVGSTSREATREEEGRLYQTARLVRYETKITRGAGIKDFDQDRIENYFRDILNRSVPEEKDLEGWRRLLLNSDLLITEGATIEASVAGLLLFGKNPNRWLPQAGVTAVAFPGIKKDYNTVDEERIRGPLVSRISKRGSVIEKGVIDRTVDFIKRNMGSIARLEGGRRRRKGAFPIDPIRETVVNAVAHRDYAYEGTDIEVSMYSDRIDVISPGRLPNGVTVEKMKEGVVRVARNELLKEILRDYGYIDHYGMGVRHKIIETIRLHNGIDPDLVEEDDRFLVRLWKSPSHVGSV
ncbi:MAG: putative DNA binding domain-containing protein [Rhodobacteraceae bacterium]|nr:putative DNA binding domain-containing protein [Paracoccaceae bacterium]MCY4328260.1 putative DNA binding domain-containing protein [Paracoccaceae bacterium]